MSCHTTFKQTIQNQKNRLENINSEESKMHQLVSDIKNLKSKQKYEQVQFEAILAKSKKEIYIKDEQIKDLQKIIKTNMVPSQKIPTQTKSFSVINKAQEKVLEFNCGECKTTFISTNKLDNHVQRDHTKGADNLFQKLKNKIIPNEPKEEFKCGKCGFNAETVSNFMNHICSKEMKIIMR